jgi:hypothetical protein
MMTMSESEIPPKNEGCIAEIPDLEEGDEVVVKTRPGYDTNRTLTVEEVNPPESRTRDVDALEWTEDEDQVILSGYGTTYALMVTYSLTKSWKRVNLVWKSRPEGIEVEDIEAGDSNE